MGSRRRRPRCPIRYNPRVMIALRYGLPGLFFVVGFALLIIRRDSTGLEGWALCVGAGLSVLLFNLLFRMGASGDADRKAEEEAREFFSEHGHWPDEPPRA